MPTEVSGYSVSKSNSDFSVADVEELDPFTTSTEDLVVSLSLGAGNASEEPLSFDSQDSQSEATSPTQRRRESKVNFSRKVEVAYIPAVMDVGMSFGPVDWTAAEVKKFSPRRRTCVGYTRNTAMVLPPPSSLANSRILRKRLSEVS